MNQDIALGEWKHFGETIVKQWWPEFTTAELDCINGNWRRLVCKVQEKFGYANYARAEIECRARLNCNESNDHVLFPGAN